MSDQIVLAGVIGCTLLAAWSLWTLWDVFWRRRP